MNLYIKTVSAIAVFAAASFGAVAAQAATAPVQDTYHYGQHLDIQKVVADNADDSLTCQVVGAHMTYLDSHNQEHVLNYRRMAEACNMGD